MYLTPYSTIIDTKLREGTLGLLITPQSHRPAQYEVSDFSYWAADNGCYTLGESFELDAYIEWLESFDVEAKRRALFATAPDVVGDWAATLERSVPTFEAIHRAGYPVALVLQDGATIDSVPWDDIEAVFVGGSTEWKLGPEAAALTEHAAELGLWVHVGRVNSIKRMVATGAMGAHSVDGTLLIFGPQANLPRILRAIEATYEAFGDVEVSETWNRWAA